MPGQAQGIGGYGEHVADEIVANCGAEVALAPKELRVANELSERIGYIRKESVTKSLTIHGLLANRSKSVKVEVERLSARIGEREKRREAKIRE